MPATLEKAPAPAPADDEQLRAMLAGLNEREAFDAHLPIDTTPEETPVTPRSNNYLDRIRYTPRHSYESKDRKGKIASDVIWRSIEHDQLMRRMPSATHHLAQTMRILEHRIAAGGQEATIARQELRSLRDATTPQEITQPTTEEFDWFSSNIPAEHAPAPTSATKTEQVPARHERRTHHRRLRLPLSRLIRHGRVVRHS